MLYPQILLSLNPFSDLWLLRESGLSNFWPLTSAFRPSTSDSLRILTFDLISDLQPLICDSIFDPASKPTYNPKPLAFDLQPLVSDLWPLICGHWPLTWPLTLNFWSVTSRLRLLIWLLTQLLTRLLTRLMFRLLTQLPTQLLTRLLIQLLI